MVKFKVGGRGPSTLQLKRRFQLLVLGTLVFMVTVSFFILKPEVFSNPDHGIPDSAFSDFEPAPGGRVVVNRIDLPPSEMELEDQEAAHVPVEKQVEQLVRKYRVDFWEELGRGRSAWTVAAGWVTARQVLPDVAPELGAVLNALVTSPITSVGVGIKGTQLKLSMKLAGGQTIVFKPKWYEREYIVEGPPYAGRDRHNGEIAAFHLSRILGLRRTPIAVGRTVSLSREVIPVASQELLQTFYEQEGDTCFYGKCYYCNKANSLCVKGDMLEGTVVLWLPTSFHLKSGKNPWRRTYRDNVVPRWEKDPNYCSIIRRMEPFKSNTTLLLDLIDTAVFDFLVGNADRHHYEVVDGVEQGMLVMLDNGKSFGNPHHDEVSILAPLYQCCSIRYTTWQRLQLLQHGILSKVLEQVLQVDPLSPVLTSDHLQAMDRRLDKVLHEVEKCISVKGLHSVVIESKPRHNPGIL